MSAHRDRVTSLAHTTLDLGQKVDTVLRVQEQQGGKVGAVEARLPLTTSNPTCSKLLTRA
jgi:hypothetical protein